MVVLQKVWTRLLFQSSESLIDSDAAWHYWQSPLRSSVLSLADGGLLRGSEAHPPNALTDKWPHYSSAGHVVLIQRTPRWWLAPRETSALHPCQALGLFWEFFLTWLVTHTHFPGPSQRVRSTYMPNQKRTTSSIRLARVVFKKPLVNVLSDWTWNKSRAKTADFKHVM